MYNKFENTQVGDFVAHKMAFNKGYLLAQVTKVTKTTIAAEVVPSGDYSGGYKVRINKRTGRENGDRAFWYPVDDPEEIHRLNREAQRLAQQRIEEQKRLESEKMAAVKAANPHGLEPTILPQGIRMIEWQDRLGRWNLLFYAVSEYTSWSGRVGVVIHPTQYGPVNMGEGFSMPASQLGDSEEDAVLKLLARQF